MLPNKGAEALAGKKKIEVDQTEELKSLSVEEVNKLLDEHASEIKTLPIFKRGDMVENSKLVEISDSPLMEGQKAIVVISGQDAAKLTGDPDRDCIINYVNKNGKLSRAGMNRRFLKKYKGVK